VDGMDDPGRAIAETRTAARGFDAAVQREFAKRKLVMAWVWYGGLPLALFSWGSPSDRTTARSCEILVHFPRAM